MRPCSVWQTRAAAARGPARRRPPPSCAQVQRVRPFRFSPPVAVPQPPGRKWDGSHCRPRPGRWRTGSPSPTASSGTDSTTGHQGKEAACRRFARRRHSLLPAARRLGARTNSHCAAGNRRTRAPTPSSAWPSASRPDRPKPRRGRSRPLLTRRCSSHREARGWRPVLPLAGTVLPRPAPQPSPGPSRGQERQTAAAKTRQANPPKGRPKLAGRCPCHARGLAQAGRLAPPSLASSQAVPIAALPGGARPPLARVSLA